MKKIIAIICVVVIAMAGIVGCGGGGDGNGRNGGGAVGEVFNFRLAHVNNFDHPYDIAAIRFAELVYEGTNGNVRIDVFNSGVLGNEGDIIEQVQMDALEFGLVASAPFAQSVPSMFVFDLPFLFATREAAYEVLDSDVGMNILAELEGLNMVGLGFWENGFRNISNSIRPVRTPDDLTGLKIRTMQNEIHMESFLAMGAMPTPMAWGEVFTALQQGTIDGLENSPIIYQTNAFWEVQTYKTITNHFYSPAVFFMSRPAFNRLPAEYQQVIIDSERIARDYQRYLHRVMDEAAIQVLTDNGMQITEIDVDLWRASVESVYEQYMDMIGADLVNAILGM